MQFLKDQHPIVKLLLCSNVLYVLKLICFPFSFLVLIWVYEKGQTFVILRINFISSFFPKNAKIRMAHCDMWVSGCSGNRVKGFLKRVASQNGSFMALCCCTHAFFNVYSQHGLQTPRESFFSKIPNFWAWAHNLQLGQISFGAFGVFLANLSAPILV